MGGASDKKISKRLSYWLRHAPEAGGIELDEAGWVDVNVLLEAFARSSTPLERSRLERIVAESDKQRFAFSADGVRIRANQGHSVSVDLGYEPAEPPAELFHGTVGKALPSIREKGLLPQSRHHVHLSADRATAKNVGSRRGRPVVLTVNAAAMVKAGHVFFRSANGVWLTDVVPAEFLFFPE